LPNKQLTASVRLNTTQFEQKLKKIARGIDALNNSVRKQGNAYQAVNAALGQTNNQVNKVKKETDKWKQSMNNVNGAVKSTNSTLGNIGTKLKRIASTYLGIMGTKAVINTSDTITKAQNKLNNLNGGDAELTQLQMDKMYASANKVRMAYTDMLSNASKSMTLAGGAFQGNMDNAIRFQEIMAEAYALGGASQEEMSTSMYQMIQALGAGTLAGDELRSVREGAPLAYKAIEEFAQGVYNSEESLKDLASQGKITSDMVVAAIMNSGAKMDEQFGKTAMTFEQAWDRIKNAAIKAFEPVSNALNDMLNRAAENGAFEKIEQAFWNISKVLQIVFKLVENTIVWIADNWSWLQHILIAGLILYASYLIITTAIAIQQAFLRIKAWLMEYGSMMAVVGGILMLIYVFYLWKTAAIDTCNAIVLALLVVAAVCFVVFGWEVALVIAIVALVIWAFEYVCGLIALLAAIIVDILSAVWNIIVYVVQAIAAAVAWVIAFIVNLVMGCGKSIGAIAENIGIAFSNAWTWAKNTFWEFIADVLRGVSKLEPVINGIAGLLGKKGVDFGGLISAAESKKGTYKDYVSVGSAWSDGWNTVDRNKWTSNTWNFVGKAHTGFVDPLAWGSAAMNWGSGIKNGINQWGSQFQNAGSKGSGNMLDNIGNSLGLDFGNASGGFPNANDPAYDTGKAYNAPSADDLLKGVDDIANNTGDIKDSMGLAEEDLEYLRKIAAMEWKKEFTTATITVDMTNNNTVNGDSDLDGIVTKLSDKLYEELSMLADGVYA
jgi:tape measure domain-containing protein